MYRKSEKLIQLLHQRFDYTGDNNRDLLMDETFSLAEVTDELDAEHAYQYLIAHLSRCDEATDKACWGD